MGILWISLRARVRSSAYGKYLLLTERTENRIFVSLLPYRQQSKATAHRGRANGHKLFALCRLLRWTPDPSGGGRRNLYAGVVSRPRPQDHTRVVKIGSAKKTRKRPYTYVERRFFDRSTTSSSVFYPVLALKIGPVRVCTVVLTCWARAVTAQPLALTSGRGRCIWYATP